MKFQVKVAPAPDEIDQDYEPSFGEQFEATLKTAAAYAAMKIKGEVDNSWLSGPKVLNLHIEAYRSLFEAALLDALSQQQVRGVEQYKSDLERHRRSLEPTATVEMVEVTEAVRAPDGRLAGSITRRVPAAEA
jgi:hypothetical protein